jgi:choline dehydrogenase-like flavoprotein
VAGVKGKRIDPDSRQVAGSYTLRAPIVCLAGGVIQTPAVLLRSGLEGKHKQAGANFQVHGHTFVYGVMPEKINMQFGAPQSVGVMEFSDIYGNNGPGYLIEGLGFLPSGFATFVQGLGAEHQKGMEDFDHVAMADAITRDRTRGRITIEGDDGHAVPLYNPIESDRKMYIDSMRRIAECLLAAGTKEAVIPACRNNPVRSMKDLDAAVESIHPNTTAEFIASAHLFSSARMAGSPEKGFCNSEGESWETKGLYVTDGSALPSNLGCNPQVTIMSASLRIADGIVKSRRAG